MSSMRFDLGRIFFHRVTDIRAHISDTGTTKWVDLHVTHQDGNRLDEVTIFAHMDLLKTIADFYPRGEFLSITASPLPTLHHPTPVLLKPDCLEFKETTIHLGGYHA